MPDQCCGVRQVFDERMARTQLRRFRKKGPDKATRVLTDALASLGVRGARLLDIGGGVGAIPDALIANGATGVTSVDASPAYAEAQRRFARERGWADRLAQREGNFIELAESLEPADVVTLDKVICCFDDMPALVGRSAAHARRLWGAVYPRDVAPARAFSRAHNFVRRLMRHDFRSFIHPVESIRAVLREQGLVPRFEARTLVWEVVVWERN